MITIITIKKQKYLTGAIIYMFSFPVLLGFRFVVDLHIVVMRIWGFTSYITISLTLLILNNRFFSTKSNAWLVNVFKIGNNVTIVVCNYVI